MKRKIWNELSIFRDGQLVPEWLRTFVDWIRYSNFFKDEWSEW